MSRALRLGRDVLILLLAILIGVQVGTIAGAVFGWWAVVPLSLLSLAGMFLIAHLNRNETRR